jgi:plastocyanin
MGLRATRTAEPLSLCAEAAARTLASSLDPRPAEAIARVVKYRNVNAFHVLGALFALWAVTLAALGITREDFPRTRGQALAVGTLSVLLAVAAIGSGIITSALEEEEDEGGAEAEGQAPEGEGRTLRITADPGGELRFDTRALEAEAGQVTIRMENPSSVPHNVSIDGGGVDEEGKTVRQGGTSTVRAELRPGEYAFYCSVAGHREGGMEGTLTVR